MTTTELDTSLAICALSPEYIATSDDQLGSELFDQLREERDLALKESRMFVRWVRVGQDWVREVRSSWLGEDDEDSSIPVVDLYHYSSKRLRSLPIPFETILVKTKTPKEAEMHSYLIEASVMDLDNGRDRIYHHSTLALPSGPYPGFDQFRPDLISRAILAHSRRAITAPHSLEPDTAAAILEEMQRGSSGQHILGFKNSGFLDKLLEFTLN